MNPSPWKTKTEGTSVVDVARSEAKGQPLPPVPLEPVEPAHRGLLASGDLLENCVAVDPAVVTHQRSRIHERDSGVFSLAGVQVDAKRH